MPAGMVGVPVRLTEPIALSLIGPGDRVDLYRGGDGDQAGALIAGDVRVLAVAGSDDPTTGGLLLALTPRDAERAVAVSSRGFAVVLRPG